MTLQDQPYREPLGTTLARTFAIALVLGGVIAYFQGGLARWPLAMLLVLWPSFGGHWVEVWFLNGLRPRISSSRAARMSVRLMVWFLAGVIFAFCMKLTARALAGVETGAWLVWWVGGLGFIGIELVAHLGLQLIGRPSFYNGRGYVETRSTLRIVFGEFAERNISNWAYMGALPGGDRHHVVGRGSSVRDREALVDPFNTLEPMESEF